MAGGECDADSKDRFVCGLEHEHERVAFPGGVTVKPASFGFGKDLADEDEIRVVAVNVLSATAAGGCQHTRGFVAIGEDEVDLTLFKDEATVGLHAGMQNHMLAFDSPVALHDLKTGGLGGDEVGIPATEAIGSGKLGPPDLDGVLLGTRVRFDGTAEKYDVASCLLAERWTRRRTSGPHDLYGQEEHREPC